MEGPLQGGKDAETMTRELKLALILGSSLVLVVGVLISDHLSGARDARIARVDPPLVAAPVEQMPPLTAGRPRAEPQLAGGDDLVTISPLDQSFNDPRVALGDPLPQTAQDTTPSNHSSLAQLTEWARQQGVTFEPVDEFAAAKTDPVASPLELVMGQPVAPKEPAESANRGAPSTTSQTSEYTVQAGDNLWQIAAKYLGNGSRHNELAAINADRLGPNGELRVGTKIRVPATAGATTPPPAAKKSEPKKPASSPSAKTYTVKAGDTLRKIAGKTLGSESRWKELYENNKSQIKDPDALRVGATLKIPST